MDLKEIYNDRILDNSEYQDLFERYMELASNEGEKNDLADILEGRYQDGLMDKIQIRSNPDIEISRRMGLANLYVYNKDIFDYVVEKNLNMFHGTTSGALEGILRDGLRTSTDLGDEVKTGEAAGIHVNKPFISFTNDLLLAEGYASFGYKNGEFPIVIGTSYDKTREYSRISNIHSDFPEVGVREGLPLEAISFVGVPSEYVEELRVMSNGSINILPYDNIGRGFSSCYEGQIGIYEDRYQEIKEAKTNKQI